MTDLNPEPQQPIEPLIARRHLLKILGAGAVTPLILPEQWLKPIVEIGHLPLHAQTSTSTAVISNLVRFLVALLPTCTRNGNTGNDYQISFNYSNPLGGMGAGVIVTQTSVYDNGISTSFTKTLTAINFSGTTLVGSVNYTFCAAFGSANSVTTSISLQTTTGDSSNTIVTTISKPVGALDVSQNSQAWEIS